MSRFHALTVSEVRRETADSVSVRLAVPEALKPAFAFAPGQYLTLRAVIDGEELRRSYSICSGLGEGDLRVGIKKVKGGAFSTFANENLKAGDVIEAMPPEGRFVAVPDPLARRHILCVAAGSGITPVLSIAKSLLAREPAVRVTLVYGNRTSAGMMFAEEIEDLKNRHLGRLAVIHVLSREPQDVPLLSGRIDAGKLRALADGVIDLSSVDEAYLCGPQAMVEAVKAELLALGLAEGRVHSELFTAAAPRARFRPPTDGPADAVLAEVTVTLDGRRASFPLLAGDDSLIEAAARAGVELPYSCRGGMCCTCRCHVEAGRAEMAVNYSLEPWETEAGFILACQARPTTPTLSLDFDRM
jgi:ring-1,2-phenylacetyl-CoA epoxidase subunit PaaE